MSHPDPMCTAEQPLGVDPLARHSLSPAELKEVLDAERAGGGFLAYRDPASKLRLLSLGPGTPITIGRNPDAAVSLSWDRQVSGVHAQLEFIGGEWTLVDDGISRNG